MTQETKTAAEVIADFLAPFKLVLPHYAAQEILMDLEKAGFQISPAGRLPTRQDPLTMETARGLAAQAWCDPTCGHKEMDSVLAESFATILYRAVANPPEGEDTKVKP